MRKAQSSIIILSLVFGLFSCIGTNIPKTEKRAKKRLAKHLVGIKNITNTYPDLIDTFTLVLHDTITVEKHDVDTAFISVKDTAFVDALLFDFLAEPNEARVRTVERVRTLRNEIIKEVLKDTTFVYEDSLIKSTITLKDGKFYYKSTIKEKKLAYVKEVKTTLDTDCAIKKDFWQDYKFWLLLLILLILGIIRHKTHGKE